MDSTREVRELVEAWDAEAEFLNERELAAQLSVDPSTLRVWDREGIGPPRLSIGGRTVRYARADAMRWLNNVRSEAGLVPRDRRMLLTSVELAAILRVTVVTLSHWRQRGIGPAYIQFDTEQGDKGGVRYSNDDVDTWLAEQRVEKGMRGPQSRGAPRTQPCGTVAGYQRHRYHDEEPCEPCREAERERNRNRDRRQKVSDE